MATRKKTETNIEPKGDDFSEDLIKALNAEFQQRIAYNLATDDSPTHVKRWISTGSALLDYAIANQKEGGVPEGRIIEIYGEPSSGKSHIAFSIAAQVQKMGGLVVYIDTENGVPVSKLAKVGIDVTKRFVYCDTHCTEEVFKIAESTIEKAKVVNKKKNIPILVVWDSVAATSPKEELEGDYDNQTMGLQARVISRGMRKITGVIGQNNVTFLCLNQTRSKIGVMFGDPTTTPGGKAIPFHASVRIALTGGSKVIDKDGNVIGINAKATIKKNKVGPPFKQVEFEILFGEGIYETSNICDVLSDASKKKPIVRGDKNYQITGMAWKTFVVTTNDGEVLIEKKFQKAGFNKLLNDQELAPHIYDMLDSIMVTSNDKFIDDADNTPNDSSPELEE